MIRPTLLDIAIVLGAVGLIVCLVMLAGCQPVESEPWTKEEQCSYWNKFNANGVVGGCE